jgi:hypothetical protein
VPARPNVRRRPVIEHDRLAAGVVPGDDAPDLLGMRSLPCGAVDVLKSSVRAAEFKGNGPGGRILPFAPCGRAKFDQATSGRDPRP